MNFILVTTVHQLYLNMYVYTCVVCIHVAVHVAVHVPVAVYMIINTAGSSIALDMYGEL